MNLYLYWFTSTSTQTVGEGQGQFLDVPYVKLTLAMNPVLLNSFAGTHHLPIVGSGVSLLKNGLH